MESEPPELPPQVSTSFLYLVATTWAYAAGAAAFIPSPSQRVNTQKQILTLNEVSRESTGTREMFLPSNESIETGLTHRNCSGAPSKRVAEVVRERLNVVGGELVLVHEDVVVSRAGCALQCALSKTPNKNKS